MMKKIKYSSKLKVWWYRLLYPTVNFEGGYKYQSITSPQNTDFNLKAWRALVEWEISNGSERIYIGETNLLDKVICWLRKSNEDIE